MYGESKGAHTLLRAASEIETLASNLLYSTDNALHRPDHFRPIPFFGGWPLGEFYIFVQTFPDEAASRPGMVFSEVLFFPIDSVIFESNIGTYFGAFSGSLEEAKASLAATVAAASKVPVVSGASYETLLNNLLVNDASNPVVWVGVEDFPEALAWLWNRLPRELRRHFVFRFCFAPRHFERFPPKLIYTPSATAGRWVDYPRIGSQFLSEVPQSVVASYLDGKADGNIVKKFLAEIEAVPEDWTQFAWLESCVRYLEKLQDGDISVSEFRGLIVRIGLLSPDPRKGRKFKRTVFRQFCDLSETGGTFQDLYSLNNLNLYPFPSAAESIGKYIEGWIHKHFDRLGAENLLDLLTKVGEGADAWSTAVLTTLRGRSKAFSPSDASKLWEWFHAEPQLLDFLHLLAPTETSLHVLADACPRTVRLDVGRRLREFAKRERNWRLHAAAVGYMPPEDAISEQLRLEPKSTPANKSGLPLLLDRVGLDAAIAVLLEHRDERLIAELAARIKADGAKLDSINIANETWQELVLRMLEFDEATFWKHVRDPRNLVFESLDLLGSGSLHRMRLLDFIASSNFADISEYERRGEIWDYIPEPAKDGFLVASSAGWWKNFDPGTYAGQILEEPLETYIYNEARIIDHLAVGRSPLSELLSVYAVLPKLPQYNMVDLISFSLDRQPFVERVTSARLGKLVREKKWKAVADRILQYVNRGRRDLEPALKECVGLFGTLESFLTPSLWYFSRSSITFDDWWREFMSFLYEYYPNGPRQSKVWKKAGGHESDLLKGAVSGREEWDHAITNLRQGRASGEIDTTRIIDQIKENLPRNPIIRDLENLFFALGGKRF